MAIENLRAYALNHAPRLTTHVCLDYEQRSTLKGLYTQHRTLTARRDKLADDGDIPTSGSMGDKTPHTRIDQQITELETEIAAAEDAARPDSIAIIFRRLPATSDSTTDDGQPCYEDLLKQATDTDTGYNHDRLGDLLLRACFVAAENADGKPVEGGWDDVLTVLDYGDLGFHRNALIGFHQIGSTIPFDPRTSGKPATT